MIESHGPNAPRMASIQALRGIAAVAVVLGHAARHVNKAFGAPELITLFQAGHAGVDLFFVISGFIILFVHRLDVGWPACLGRYLNRRFTRVMPLYWIALAVTLAIAAMAGHAFPPVSTLAWSALLLPSVHEPLLGIAWTLQCEIVFYAVFAILIVSRAAGVVVMAAWFASIAVAEAGAWFGTVPQSLLGVFGLEFLMGMAAAQLVSFGHVRRPAALALAGLACFLAMMALESLGVVNGYANWARLVYGPAAALLIAGLAAIEQAERIHVPRWLQSVGEASYSIYLFQFVFIGGAWYAWQLLELDDPATRLVCFVVLVTASFAGGLLACRCIERPLLSLMRGREAGRGLRRAGAWPRHPTGGRASRPPSV